MVEAAIGFLACCCFPILVIVVVGLFNGWLGRLMESRRPVEDRIRDVRNIAALNVQKYEGSLLREDCPDWIPPLIDFYRQLEALAGAPKASVIEIEKLANEAHAFLQDRRLRRNTEYYFGFRDLYSDTSFLAQLVKRRPPPV